MERPLLSRTTFGARQSLGLLVLSTLFALQGVVCLNTMVLYSPDSANYLGWAQSLSQLRGFTIPFNAEPSHYVPNAPLYPVLLAPLALFFPANMIAAKLFMLILALLIIVFLFRDLEKSAGRTAAAACGMLLVLQPAFLLYSTQALSEIPFVLSMLLTFILLERLLQRQGGAAIELTALLVALAACQFLRDLGLVLALSVVLLLFWRKKTREAWVVLSLLASLYVLWVLFNEGIAASGERPELRNSVLFFSRVYAGSESSLAGEFLARLRTNAPMYARQAAGMLFMSEYGHWSYGVVRMDDPALNLVRGALAHVRLVVMAATVAFLWYGFVRLCKESSIGGLILLFSALYSLAIILYPVIDSRFLFPLLVPMMFSFAYGVKGVIAWTRTRRGAFSQVCRIVLAGLFLLLLIPHVVWSVNYIATSREYRRDPVALSASFAGMPAFPSGFARLLPEAAEWIARNADSSAIVMCKYKEIALWLEGRKVMNPDPVVSVADFRHLLRDYRPSFLVNTLEGHHWSDFDFQTSAIRHFAFVRVFRLGDTEVLRILPAEGEREPSAVRDSSADPQRARFVRAAMLMNERGERSANESLRLLAGLTLTDNPTLTYYAGLGAQFALRLRIAETLYQRLQSMPQAGAYTVQASSREQEIRLLRLAAQSESPDDKASSWYAVARAYWQMGVPGRSMDMLDSALQAAPSFLPALVLGVQEAFEAGDLAAGRAFYKRARRVEPQASTVQAWGSILDAVTEDSSGPVEVKAARALSSLGLQDDAIDRLVRLLEKEPGNEEARRQLVDIYVSLGRRGPAQDVLGPAQRAADPTGTGHLSPQ